MEPSENPHNVDLESGGGGGCCRSSAAAREGGGGRCSSSDEGDGDSQCVEEHRETTRSGDEIVGVLDRRRESCVSECSEEVVDMEAGGEESSKLHLAKTKRDCRICHLSLDSEDQESGFPFELGCYCKDDLAITHKQCAETWFKIRGNKICEICGSIARNVPGPTEADLSAQWNEANAAAAAATASAPAAPPGNRNLLRGHRFLNFLLACMVFAFVISWMFHFNVPS